MKKNSGNWLLCCSLLALLFGGCSTDFEVIAPYKETMVVYGLLNPADSIQYIRISKAFLGEGNALIMAQQPDSIYYGDYLDVKIERYLNEQLIETHSLTRITSIPKDTGMFSNQYQVNYADANHIYNDRSEYKLTIKNNKTGLTAVSQTVIIGSDFKINYPSGTSGRTQDFSSAPVNISYKLQTSTTGKIYEMKIRVHYIEIDKADTNVKASKSFDWDLSEQVPIEISSSKEILFTVYRPDFFRLMQAYIPVDNNKTRKFTGVNDLEIFGIAGTVDLYTYLQLTKPSNGIVQDRPVFSNIDNGVGLFTSRSIIKETANLSLNTLHYVDTSAATKNLNFKNF